MSVSHKSKEHSFNIDHESRITRLEVINENICQTLIRLEIKMDENLKNITHKFENLEKKMDEGFKEVDKKIDKINNRLWFNFYWMIGGFAGILGLIAHALHWIK
jgi:hypothetical protein